MLAKRIIPCLDVKDGRTVKGINFENFRYAGDPVELGKRYSDEGADELVFLDITASLEGRKTFVQMVRRVAENLSIPFTVGGGIGSVGDVSILLNAGADKVSVNSSALKNPQLIDGLSAYDARACVEEVNRVFCGGKYDYMMPNKTHDRAGVQYPGVRDDGTWDDKATLRQMCEDVAWMEAAQKGVGELQKILDKGYGAKLGMTGENYAALSLRDKAKKILDMKAIPGADELSESFKTWMNSWSTAQKPTHRDVATGAVGGAVLTKKVPNEDWLKAMRKPDEYDDADVGVMVNGRYHYEKVVTQPFKKGMFWDTPEKFEWRPNDNGMVTVDGKKYTLVSTDDNGKKLVRPFFVSDDGSTLEGYISGIDKGAHDYYKFSNYDEKNPVHEAAVKNAMQKVGAKDMDDFGEKVWMAGGRVLEVDGDRFFARRTKDGYRIEVGDGGRSEYEWNVVSKFQDQFDNERNAMNAIVVREIFNANPEVLRWYSRYMETAKDNTSGRFDRHGDSSKVFDEFMDEYKQYESHHKRRLSMKPGITGLWQVSGRSNIEDFEEVVKLDVTYIDNWSLWNDVKILFKTVYVVFAGRGAK